MIRNLRLPPIVFGSVLGFLSTGVIEAQQIPQTLYQEMRWRMIGLSRGGPRFHFRPAFPDP